MAHANLASDTGLHAIAITDGVEYRSRLFARIWSVATIAVFVALAATVGVPHGPDLETWEKTAQLSTLGVLIVGVAMAWRLEGVGGSIMMVGSVTLGVLAALQHQPLVALLPAVAFLVPAVGFLIAWHRTKTYAAVVTLATALLMLMVTGGLAAQAMYHHGYGPAHPQSTLPALPDSAVTWFWFGAVTDTSGVVIARLDPATQADLVAAGPAGETTNFTGVLRGGVWQFDLQGLEPATEYTYSFVVDNAPASERIGRLRTFATGPMSFSIAVGSCSRLGSNGAVYETILATDPDLFLVPGDFFYADHMTTAAHFTEAFDETLTQPAQAALLAAVPIGYVWDDHDYGGNDADGTSPTRDLARDAFSTYVPHYPLTADTINQAFTIGRARIVLLDARSARDPKSEPDGPDKTMLGTAQMEWLRQELLQAQESHQLIILVTPVPWIAAPEEGADHWGGYTTERQALAEFIAANQIENLVMLAGDAHMIAIDDGANTNFSTTGNVTFPLLHAAALDRPGSVKGGPYSEGTYPGGGQYGLVEVEDNGSDSIVVRLAGMDWTGDVIVEHSFTVAVSP